MDSRVELDESTLRSCVYCSHRAICALYDALVDAVIIIDSFNEVGLAYEAGLYETLASYCCQFTD